jgi:hypothetical protein
VPTPDEPTAVLVAGAAGSGRSEVVGALLGAARPLIDLPPGSYLVIGHGNGDELFAYVPGLRQPQRYRARRGGEGLAAVARPPRRIEMTLADPLLRHFVLVDSPNAESLGAAGISVLLDVAVRGGALVYVIGADRPLSTADLDVLAEAATRKVVVFFAVTPGRGVADETTTIGGHRTAVLGRAPQLVDAPWYSVDPATGDTAYLRRALTEWAGAEGLRRASAGPPAWTSARGGVRVAADGAESGWQELLDGLTHTNAHSVRQRLAIELANAHLRCVQEILFGGGPAGMPASLDRELHALSLLATDLCNTVVDRIVDAVLGRVLIVEPDPGVRRRVVAALRRYLAEDSAAADIDRVLLVTSTGGIAGVVGPEALAALPAYRSKPDAAVLAPVGLGVSGGCYQLWRGPANADPEKARSWLQRSIRAVELDLLREITRRLEAVRRSLTTLVSETVDHGILIV